MSTEVSKKTKSKNGANILPRLRRGRSTAGCSKFSDSVSSVSTSKRPSPPVATNRLAAREKTWLVFDLIRRTVPATNTGAMAARCVFLDSLTLVV
jgi:hypothetical protein